MATLGEYQGALATQSPLADNSLFSDGNLVSYWKLDGNSNDSKGSNNGTDTSISYSTANGKFSEGAGLNGSSSKISVPYYNSNANSSVSAWVKTTTAGDVRIWSGRNSGSGNAIYNIGVGTGIPSFRLRDTAATALRDATATTDIRDGLWHHVCSTYNGSTYAMIIYVDGVQQGTNTFVSGAVTIDTTNIGADPRDGAYFNGAIDDVAVFSRVLTAAEVASIYQTQGATKLLLHLNGNSTDSSGNGNNGTDTSVTYSQANGKFGQGAGFVAATPSRISLPTAVRQSGSFTFNVWFYPTTVAPTFADAYFHTDWSGSGKNYILWQENATLAFLNGNGSTLQDTVIKGGTVVVNTWQMATFTRSGALISIYLNGHLVNSATGSYSGGTTANNIFIGADSAASAGYGFGGNLDEVIIENVAWSAAKVKQYYTFTKGRFGII